MDHARTLPQPLTRERVPEKQHGLRDVLGAEAWNRLPETVRERFADSAAEAFYVGAFEVVQANLLGRAIAWLGTWLGTPVAPRTQCNVEARVHVRPDGEGVSWAREYCWADGTTHVVKSSKVVTDECVLVEKLPARLCMPLDTYVDGGVLHFVSRGYFFDLRFGASLFGGQGFGFRLWLPGALSPGTTHVEHIDLGHGWFRFTMTVTHPVFGNVFFQTGRFCAAEESP